MTTLMTEDGSRDLQAKLAAARNGLRAEGKHLLQQGNPAAFTVPAGLLDEVTRLLRTRYAVTNVDGKYRVSAVEGVGR